jgi:hypothetical protein
MKLLLTLPLVALLMSCTFAREKQTVQPQGAIASTRSDDLSGSPSIYPNNYEGLEPVVISDRMVFAFGGKGAIKFGNGTAAMWNNEKSFRDFMLGAGVIAGSVAQASTAAAEQATAQVALKEGTKRRAAEQATAQATVAARERVATTAIGMEMPVPVTPP